MEKMGKRKEREARARLPVVRDKAEQRLLVAGDDCSVEAEKFEAGSLLRGTVVDRWG